MSSLLHPLLNVVVALVQFFYLRNKTIKILNMFGFRRELYLTNATNSNSYLQQLSVNLISKTDLQPLFRHALWTHYILTAAWKFMHCWSDIMHSILLEFLLELRMQTREHIENLLADTCLWQTSKLGGERLMPS